MLTVLYLYPRDPGYKCNAASPVCLRESLQCWLKTAELNQQLPWARGLWRAIRVKAWVLNPICSVSLNDLCLLYSVSFPAWNMRLYKEEKFPRLKKFDLSAFVSIEVHMSKWPFGFVVQSSIDVGSLSFPVSKPHEWFRVSAKKCFPHALVWANLRSRFCGDCGQALHKGLPSLGSGKPQQTHC